MHTDVTVAKARAGIEKLVHLTLRTARVIQALRKELYLLKRLKAVSLVYIFFTETLDNLRYIWYYMAWLVVTNLITVKFF